MTLNVLDVILIVLMVQALSITPFLILHRGKRSRSNRILAVFLAAKALCISNFLCFRLFDWSVQHVPHLFYVGASFTMLWGPLLYLYIKSLTEKKFRMAGAQWLHVLPAVLHLLYMAWVFHRFSVDTKQALLMGDAVLRSGVQSGILLYLNISVGVYLILAFRQFGRYRKGLKEMYSSFGRHSQRWALVVLTGFTLKWGLDALYMLGPVLIDQNTVLYLSRAVLFVFLNVMMYFGFRHGEVFGSESPDDSGSRKTLSDSMTADYLGRLQDCMKTDRPFLEPGISLAGLSRITNIPLRSLSLIINQEYGQNFFDFINAHRVEAAQQYLCESQHRGKTVSEILYEVGFNSKSSFHAAFRRHAGMTPSQYRKTARLSLS